MESKKSKPNQTKVNQSEPNQSKPTNQQTPDNRQLGLPFRLLLYISISLYLCASISPYLCAYLRAYLCRLFACLCSRINTKRPLRTYTSPTLPPLIRERENLGSLSSIFFLNFFWEIFFWNFFCRISQGSFFHKALFVVVGIFERVYFLS